MTFHEDKTWDILSVIQCYCILFEQTLASMNVVELKPIAKQFKNLFQLKVPISALRRDELIESIQAGMTPSELCEFLASL